MASSLSYIFCLVLLTSSYKESYANCQPKKPDTTFKTSNLAGKFYLVALKQGYNYQTDELHCATATVNGDTTASPLKYVVSYQNSDGDIKTINLSISNISPGVYKTVGNDDGETVNVPISVVLGSTNPPAANVFYACHSGQASAVWVYYNKRVNGIDEMDTDIKEQVKRILLKNNIPLSELKSENNTNCNN